MSNEKKSEHAAEKNPKQNGDDPFKRADATDKASETDGAKPAEDPAQAEAQTSEAESPEERIRDLEERLKRAVAEQENLRKRMEREKADVAKYAVSNFAREVLGIADNIQRAIDAVPREAAEKDTALKTFLDGIEVTERELHKAMQRQGISKMNPDGEKFDPNFHQAMFEVPTADQPSGVVVQVVQPGYLLEDRVLRPAMVGVSKAIPAATASDNDPGGSEETSAKTEAAAPQGGQQKEQTGQTAGDEPSGPRPANDDTAPGGKKASAEAPESDRPSSQARGSSRLNEPVIETDTTDNLQTGKSTGQNR